MINENMSREEFADFICELRENLLKNPDGWENKDMERFLSAMEAWIRSIDGYANNSGDNMVLNPSWSTFAKILSAAKIYE